MRAQKAKNNNYSLDLPKLDLESFKLFVDLLAQEFSHKKQTQKAYKKVFYYVLYVNQIKKVKNSYGFSIIPAVNFKLISKKTYVDVLKDLVKKQIIFTTTPVGNDHLGVDFDTGTHITRGYKISDEFMGSLYENEQKYGIKTEVLLNQLSDYIFDETDPVGIIKVLNKSYSEGEFIKNNKSTAILADNSVKEINKFNNRVLDYKSFIYFKVYSQQRWLENYYFSLVNSDYLEYCYKQLLINYSLSNSCEYSFAGYKLVISCRDLVNNNYSFLNSYLNYLSHEQALACECIINNYFSVKYYKYYCSLLNIFKLNNDKYISNQSYEQALACESLFSFLSLDSILSDSTLLMHYGVTNILDKLIQFIEEEVVGEENIVRLLDKNEEYKLRETYKLLTLNKELFLEEVDKKSTQYKLFVQAWNSHSEVKKSGNRLFSWFHSVSSSERKYLNINGSGLIEAFDVPACNFCLLGKLLEKSKNVNKDELKEFQRILKEDYIYGLIAKSQNLDINNKDIKKAIKTSCQHWLNIRKKYLNFAKRSKKDPYFNVVDNYIKSTFPTIYEVLINWNEQLHKNKISKMLWNDFQEVEFNLISTKITNYLVKKYHVTPVTVHDALYLSKNDLIKVTEPIENIFWQLLEEDVNTLFIGTNKNTIEIKEVIETTLKEIDYQIKCQSVAPT